MNRFGVDLGTTNTCMFLASFPLGGTIEEFELRPIKIHYQNTGDNINPPLEDSMPSAIYGRRRGDSVSGDYEFLLGTVAEKQAALDNVPEIINTKRLLCREDPTTEIAYGLTAQDVAQKLLEGCYYSLKKNFEDKHDRFFKSAKYCITQPAAFGLFASRSIQEAAIPAGFASAEAQREPIAALLSFLQNRLYSLSSAKELLERQKQHDNKLLTMVVDIGGGTTDVTIQEIRITGQVMPEQGCEMCTGYKIEFLNMVRDDKDDRSPVATANQEAAFGGFDFDKRIAEIIASEWNRQYKAQVGHDYDWKSLGGKTELSGLYRRVKLYKQDLSRYQDGFHAGHDETIMLDGLVLSCRLDSNLVYGCTKELCEADYGTLESDRTVYGIIADTIRRSGYSVDDIDYLYVTGGMSNFKPIRDMMMRRFSGLNDKNALVFSDNPLEDIARGAACCNCFFEVEMPQTVLYADLMIDDPCGEPIPLVRKNQPLPTRKTIANFMELRNPAYLYVDVLWGQSPRDCELTRLRRLRKQLPHGVITPIGTKVSIEYEIDIHQAMNVKLIVHDKNGEYTVPLLNLIKDVDLSGGEL